jgi:hypothetical protein
MFHCGSLDGRARDGVERQGCVDVVDGVQNLQRIKETVFADKKKAKFDSYLQNQPVLVRLLPIIRLISLTFFYRNNQFWFTFLVTCFFLEI